ncbi:MAG: energy transducer TonB [Flavobacterium sp. BFFFF2]|nr:MAG: energy transducer TonB [Flavobacterium sp. BFFFF2]
MKLDIFNGKWLDLVFEGRNKAYGAYELRKETNKVTTRSLVIGVAIFGLAVCTPMLIKMIPSGSDDDALDVKIQTIKLPPKDQERPKDLPPPPPPPPKVDQVKFVKPVVAKTEEIVEEILEVKDIKEKKIGDETIKGDPDAPLRIEEEVGNGPAQQVVEEDNTLYNTNGIEVKPEFPGGIEKFYKFIASNFRYPEDESFQGGRVIVSFVVEKDGSLTDIKIVRDPGFDTGKEAERVLRKCGKWVAGEQNGKKVRCAYVLPISLPKPE